MITLQTLGIPMFYFLANSSVSICNPQLDALIGSLNVKGIRERALKRQLDKFYNTIRYSIFIQRKKYKIIHSLL